MSGQFRCGHPRSEPNLIHRKDGRTQCRTCKLAAGKREYARIKAKGGVDKAAPVERKSKPAHQQPKPLNQRPSLSPKKSKKPHGFKQRSDPVRDVLRARALEDVITLRCLFCGAHVRRKAKDAPAWFETHRQRCKARKRAEAAS